MTERRTLECDRCHRRADCESTISDPKGWSKFFVGVRRGLHVCDECTPLVLALIDTPPAPVSEGKAPPGGPFR